MSKTTSQLWTCRKPSLGHIHVWGCAAEARIYNIKEKQLVPRTVSCFSIGNPKRSQVFRFYCPRSGVKIVDASSDKFIKICNDT